MRTVPSTALDGLTLTLGEFDAMSVEERRSLFGISSLDDVALVGPGYLDRAPRECGWYVRFRPKPATPGPKDRKQDSYELVVKRPKKEKTGEDGDAQPLDGKPERIALKAKDADNAKLDALVYLTRRSNRQRRASTWPIERIESLLVRDVVQKHIDECLADPPEGVEEDKTKRATRTTYRSQLRAFQKAFPELEIGDVNDKLAGKYVLRASDREPTTHVGDLWTALRCINSGLQLLGVQRTYRVDFKIPKKKRLPKVAWTPAEYDRVCAAADGWRFNPDGSPTMIPGPDGLVQSRRGARSIADRKAWRRAILFLPYTGSRNGRLTPTRWVPPQVEPLDGKPLPDRPWIEVDDPIVYHRDGDSNKDKEHTKHCGPLVIPEEFAPTVREWFEQDIDAGIEFVFHKADGSRYESDHLVRLTFKAILADAAVDESRVPHHFKDLCVEWSDSAGVQRETLAVHLDTSPGTIAAKYGAPQRVAKMMEAAEGLTQAAWRKTGTRNAKLVDRLTAGRQRQAAAAAANVVTLRPGTAPLQPAASERQPAARRRHPA